MQETLNLRRKKKSYRQTTYGDTVAAIRNVYSGLKVSPSGHIEGGLCMFPFREVKVQSDAGNESYKVILKSNQMTWRVILVFTERGISSLLGY